MTAWFKDSSLEISASVTRGTHVVSPVGEITIYNCSHFKAALTAICWQQPKRLIVDLHEVDYIDASGLGVLVASLKTFRDCHTVIAIVATSIYLKKLFEVTGITVLAPVIASTREAGDHRVRLCRN